MKYGIETKGPQVTLDRALVVRKKQQQQITTRRSLYKQCMPFFALCVPIIYASFEAAL